MKREFLFTLILLCPFLIKNDRCSRINNRELPQYRLIRRSGYSEQVIISRKIVSSLQKCKEFASSKKALAFNFGLSNGHSDSPSNNYAGNKRISGRTCLALQCPETSNFTSLRNDTRYNYYSMYPGNISQDDGSLACIPKAGIFIFSEKSSNYTQARSACQKLHGTLAHVVSEERTNGLANLVSHQSPSFVGLSSHVHERFWKNEFDEPLSCFEYRAWGEGEPSNSRGCVGLVKPNPVDSSPFWKVLPCHMTLPFICEISPFRSNVRAKHNTID